MMPASQLPADPPLHLPADAAADFDVMLAAAQPRLRGYIASILGGWSDVDDLVQETNLVLLTKRGDFAAGTSFIGWAFRVAYFKTTTWRRDRMREGRVFFTDTGFQEIAIKAENYFKTHEPVVDALTECLAQLPERERALVISKYVERNNLTEQATVSGSNPNALHKTISRIRLALRACILGKLQSEAS